MLAIAGLLLLSALPIIGGVLRLEGISDGTDAPLPLPLNVAVVAHIVAMSLYCVVGAFQFSSAIRTRGSWHRCAGRVLLPLGLVAAISGIVLVIAFHGRPEEFGLALVRLVFSVALVALLVPGALAIARHDYRAHGAWMTRAYAIGVAGGTQALVVAAWSLVAGEPDAVGETWLVAAGFAVNCGVAEVVVRRRRARSSMSSAAFRASAR